MGGKGRGRESESSSCCNRRREREWIRETGVRRLNEIERRGEILPCFYTARGEEEEIHPIVSDQSYE